MSATADQAEAAVSAPTGSWFFDPDNVQVRADGGKVTLTGTVQSYHERQVAAETAWSAQGTTAVENDIEVV